MSYGFVYILGNEAMSAYKFGCTERAPHARASELSSGTAVPAHFQVICYAEFEDFQGIEKRMHTHFDEYRVSANREFFWGDCLNDAIAYLFWHPNRLAFADIQTVHYIDGPFRYPSELSNPWEKKAEATNVIELPMLKQQGGEGA